MICIFELCRQLNIINNWHILISKKIIFYAINISKKSLKASQMILPHIIMLLPNNNYMSYVKI